MTHPRWVAKPDGLTGRALDVWKNVAVPSYSRGVLTANNAEQFRCLVRCIALADQCQTEIEQFGAIIQTPSGIRRQNPAVAVLFRAQSEILRLEKHLGLDD